MNNEFLESNYSTFYKGKNIQKIYPTEFVVRSFLGTYPNLKPIKKEKFIGKKVLDLGCGDGRNIPFLNNLGFEGFGIEINQSIIDNCYKHLSLNNSKANLYIGKNNRINFHNDFFDFIIACHSCYYLDKDDLFSDNLNEVFRVLKKKGRFIFSVPKSTSYLVKNADILDDNYAIIRDDPLKIRNGTKIKFFDSKEEILSYLSNQFDSISIGSCENDWWGTHEFCWTIVSQKKE